ncbi:GGDEF domain-containing protein [Arsukibacterium ikkense]|uniref:GGDEF domain-containing protein n=1 Tax=Arsukibacterium ikkense TaxID=336831 RepID=UPI000ABAD69E|nr:GGDEF domain-containing protein [Arsukibacterium ikkense]
MQATLSKDSTQQAGKIDARRRRYILFFVSYITSSVMFFYGFKNFYAEQVLLPAILFGTAAAFLINISYFRWSGNLNLACNIEALLVGCFVLSLVYQGGFNNTALYWVFPFPAILFGLLGVKKALFSNGLLLIVLALMLFVPELIMAEYKEAEASRFIASLLIVIIVCWINDHYRERSHEAMELLQQSKEIQANTDPLTLLLNRRFIDSSLNFSLQQQADALLPMAVIICDIDHFKQLNDQYGHAAGDAVLRHLASLFRNNLRQQDIACRIGGEEFLFFLPKTPVDAALQVAEKIRHALLDNPLQLEQLALPVSASFGVASCINSDSLAAAIEHADKQLYQAKNSGRNRVC